MNTVCIVFHNSDKYNGATRSMLDLIETWKKDNLVEIVCILPNKGSACEVLNNLSIEWMIGNYHAARYLTTEPIQERIPRNFLRRIRLAKEYCFNLIKIENKLENKHIDVIYSNTGAIYFGAWLSKKMNIPHIWHIREMGEEDQNAKMLFGEKHFIKLLNNTRGIIAISNVVKNKYSRFLEDPSKVHMFYNDIMDKSSKFTIRKKDGVFNILIVGSIIEGKGHEHVIKSIKKVVDAGINVKLYVAGKNSGLYYEKMRKLTEELHITDKVVFLGHVKNMAELKDKMHLQIVASRCEAFGRITIEAMLSGLPLIGANTGCTKELIEHDVTGVLYQWGDVKSLSDSIIKCCNDYEQSIDCAKRAFEFSKEFTKGNSAKKIAGLLNEIKK